MSTFIHKDIRGDDVKVLTFGSRGVWVELLQSILKRLGFYEGEIDGIFLTQTQNAVLIFQREFGLRVDGIVGRNTWDKLLMYINGRDGNIVPTDISYSYDIMRLNLNALKLAYPFLEIGDYGETVMNKKIPYVRIGVGEKQVFYSASIHANEWINTVVFMKFIEEFSKAYVEEGQIFGYSAREIFNNTTIYIVPMANPDGVDLVLEVLPSTSSEYINALRISENYPDIPFPSGWKANIVGVDLNQQFPANWERAKEIKFAQGFVSPAPRDYVGPYPLSEPESIALYDFTREKDFKLILAYHTQGEIIFWRYLDYNPPGAEEIALEFARVSGYTLEDRADIESYAGYRDWFISTYVRPGYTVETGLGENPLPISQFDKIYQDNLGILVLGAVL